MKKKTKIFISSTIYDLIDVRQSLRHVLKNHYEAEVRTSENIEDFGIDALQHTNQICVARLLECDLVIAIIDREYGTSAKLPGRKSISVTRYEVQSAIESKIPIWFFVRKNTWKEWISFKEFARDRRGESSARISNKQIFVDFCKENRKHWVTNHNTFSFIDEISRLKESNWMFQFRDAGELIRTVEAQFPRFLVNNFYRSRKIISSLDQLESIPDTIWKLTDLSQRYSKVNLRALSAQLKYLNENKSSLPKVINELEWVKEELLDQYSRVMIGHLEFAGKGSSNQTQIFVSDASLENISPTVWRTDEYHQRVLAGSKDIARRYQLENVKYVRVILLFDPSLALGDEEWIASVKYLMEFHQRTKIRLGVFGRKFIDPAFETRLLNYYLIPGELVAIFDQEFGMAFEVDKFTYKNFVADYTELCNFICDRCEKDDGGFWLDNTMSIDIVIKSISDLIVGPIMP